MRQLTLVLFLIPKFPLAGQDRAAVNGTVTDPSGALVGNAKIELIAPATGLRREAMTSENGIYEDHAPAGGHLSNNLPIRKGTDNDNTLRSKTRIQLCDHPRAYLRNKCCASLSFSIQTASITSSFGSRV